MGTFHGGVYCDLADAAMGYAYAATLAEGESFTTVELKINFLRAVRKATLTAEAKVIKACRTICELRDREIQTKPRSLLELLKTVQAWRNY